MIKVLPLSRWKKAKFPERDAFSDEEDSDEEDSEYEEVVIPKKKQAKRKHGANEVGSLKHVKSNPKPQIHIPQKLVLHAMPNRKAPKKLQRQQSSEVTFFVYNKFNRISKSLTKKVCNVIYRFC